MRGSLRENWTATDSNTHSASKIPTRLLGLLRQTRFTPKPPRNVRVRKTRDVHTPRALKSGPGHVRAPWDRRKGMCTRRPATTTTAGTGPHFPSFIQPPVLGADMPTRLPRYRQPLFTGPCARPLFPGTSSDPKERPPLLLAGRSSVSCRVSWLPRQFAVSSARGPQCTTTANVVQKLRAALRECGHGFPTCFQPSCRLRLLLPSSSLHAGFLP